MATIDVSCPGCGAYDVVRHGALPNGKQRFRCRNTGCVKNTFLLNYTAQGRQPGIVDKIIDMAMNASGIRDTARVLKISPTTVTAKLKAQERRLSQVNTAFLKSLCPRQATVTIARVEEAEGDERWSFVGSKSRQHWLWHAIDHASGKVLAYVFGRRKDTVYRQLKALLRPFGIRRFHTDDGGAYARAPLAE